jgi:uncharacterized coiled-coil protein SlyX
MKRIIIVGVLVSLLIGLVLPGCASGARVAELEAKVAELEARLAAKNPSYNDLMGFLAEDKTEDTKYQSHVSYTFQFLKNAKERGIRGYPVVVLIPQRVLVFAGFETTDQGWIYILPAIDKEVKLEKGKSYRELNGHSPFGTGDDLIQEIFVFN